MADFTLKYDSATGQLVGEDSNGNEIPIPLNALDVSGSASIDGNVESFTAGHDDVRVPQVRNLTVEDWESGTLDTGVWDKRGGSDVSVTSNVVADGDYSLELVTTGAADYRYVHSTDGLDTYPQAGDEFEAFVYFTDTDDYFKLEFCVQNFNEYFKQADGFSLPISPQLGKTEIRSQSDSTIISNVSPPLNEFVRVNVSITLEGNVEVSLYDSSENLLGSGSLSPPDGEKYKSGGFGVTVQNINTESTIYFDMPTGGLQRREPEARANTQKGVTELGNEVVPSGAIQTGPMEVPADHPNYPMVNLPVTDDLAQGEQVGYHLAINQDKALTVEAEADGNGGIQNKQITPNYPFTSLKAGNQELKQSIHYDNKVTVSGGNDTKKNIWVYNIGEVLPQKSSVTEGYVNYVKLKHGGGVNRIVRGDVNIDIHEQSTGTTIFRSTDDLMSTGTKDNNWGTTGNVIATANNRVRIKIDGSDSNIAYIQVNRDGSFPSVNLNMRLKHAHEFGSVEVLK